MKTNKELYSFIKRLHKTLQLSGKTSTQEIILSELKQDNNESHKLTWVDSLPAHKITCSILMKYYKENSTANRLKYIKNEAFKMPSERYFSMVKKLLNRIDNIKAVYNSKGLCVTSTRYSSTIVFNLVKGFLPDSPEIGIERNWNNVIIKYAFILPDTINSDESNINLVESIKNINLVAASLRSKIKEKEDSISLLEKEKNALLSKYEKIKGSIKW